MNDEKIRSMTRMALMTAVMCILSPVTIPVGPVPVTLAVLVLYFSLYLTGTRQTLISYTIYFLLGLAGLPVFSGFSGGISKLAGPTGGYIIGFFLLILISGYFREHFTDRLIQFAGALLGLSVTYVIALVWFIAVMDSDLRTAVFACVIPFVFIDILKIILAMWSGEMISKRISNFKGRL